MTVQSVPLQETRLAIMRYYKVFFDSKPVMSLVALDDPSVRRQEMRFFSVKILETESMSLRQLLALHRSGEAVSAGVQRMVDQLQSEIDIFLQLYLLIEGHKQLHIASYEAVHEIVKRMRDDHLRQLHPDRNA